MIMRWTCYLLFIFLSLSARAQGGTLLVLGDSISAGYGISLDQGWVSLLEERLEDLGYLYRVKNASISGDTTAGALARLPDLLAADGPRISIVELGGNDGLRGLSLEEMETNLDEIISRLKEAGSRILLVPMRLPPNYGPAFNRHFEDIYRKVASRHGVRLSTFILRDIAVHSDLMQSDGVHPKAVAQQRMLDNIWDDLRPLLSMD